MDDDVTRAVDQAQAIGNAAMDLLVAVLYGKGRRKKAMAQLEKLYAALPAPEPARKPTKKPRRKRPIRYPD